MSDFTRGSRFFNAPAYTLADYTRVNPLLLPGEIAYELHPATNIPWRCKVGPGRYTDLPYQEDLYKYTDIPSNPIGDARGSLQYKSVEEILHLMLNPFIPPSLSNGRINVNSLGYQTTVTLEIGQTISSPVIVNADTALSAGLAPTNPYNITAGGNFSNEGNFSGLPANLSLTPLTPTSVKEIVINIKAAYVSGAGGFTNIVQAFLNVYPKLIWGSSNASSLAPSDWASLTSRMTSISKVYQTDYIFPSTGYLYLAIPSMLSPTDSLVFSDVTNPESLSFISFAPAGVQTINNGVGSYNYKTFRSAYPLLFNSVVRVREPS